MLDQLPCTLTRGVAATREGLEIANSLIAGIFNVRWSAYGGILTPWPDIAERLRYREGEPWCFLNGHGVMTCDTYYFGGNTSAALHRLAAILCDTADQFRVLHWCVTEFGKPMEIDGINHA